MDTAPRDGTYVELKNTYGVAPWYCIARWTDENFALGANGTKMTFKTNKPSWVKPDGVGPFSEESLHWRPYNGSVEDYVDPTGGMQNDPAYWRGAVASKYGLPINHFEKEVIAKSVSNPLRDWIVIGLCGLIFVMMVIFLHGCSAPMDVRPPIARIS